MAGLRVVSEMSAEDVERDEYTAQLDCELRKLAANVLRILRGSGKPNELLLQMLFCLMAADDYQYAWERPPSAERIRSAFILYPEEERTRGGSDRDVYRWAKDATGDMRRAEWQICRGALQLLAGRMVEQQAQVTAGRSELDEGALSYSAARERRRKMNAPKPGQRRPRGLRTLGRHEPQLLPK